MLHRYLKKYPALLFSYTNKQLVITRPSAERGPSISPLGQVCCRISSGEGHRKGVLRDGFAAGFAQAGDMGSYVYGPIDRSAIESA